jgi:hypothetical protein
MRIRESQEKSGVSNKYALLSSALDNSNTIDRDYNSEDAFGTENVRHTEPGYARTGRSTTGSPGNNAITRLNPRSTDQVVQVLIESGLSPNTQYQLYAYKEEVRYVSSITPIDDLLEQWYCLRLGV